MINLIFPNRCSFCLKISEFDICQDCEKIIDYCPDSVGDIVAIFRYSGIVRAAILRFKFKQDRSFARVVAKLMYRKITEKPDIITYIPSGFLRVRKKGYNQSKLIAKELSKLFEMDTTALLGKKFMIKSQTKMKSSAARIENIKNAFYVKNKQVFGNILLVDDVVTTGSTVFVCKKILHEFGAKTVNIIAVAKK